MPNFENYTYDDVKQSEIVDSGPLKEKHLTYGALREEYRILWDNLCIRQSRIDDIDQAVETVLQHRHQYEAVGSATGVPWYVVAALHNLETGLDYTVHLHNGDPLSAVTFNDPGGRPSAHAGPFSWVESAVDALDFAGLSGIGSWPVEKIAFLLESYNGFGYRLYHPHVKSPFLWSYGNHYDKGHFVSEGRWADDAEAPRCGAMVLICQLIARGIIAAPLTDGGMAVPAPVFDALSSLPDPDVALETEAAPVDAYFQTDNADALPAQAEDPIHGDTPVTQAYENSENYGQDAVPAVIYADTISELPQGEFVPDAGFVPEAEAAPVAGFVAEPDAAASVDEIAPVAEIVADADEADELIELPAWFVVAKGELGIRDFPGPMFEARVFEYLQTTTQLQTCDETVWASAFVNWCLLQAGFAGTNDTNARSWLSYGEALDAPKPGCIVVLWKDAAQGFKGHVGFFDGYDGNRIRLLGAHDGGGVDWEEVFVANFARERVLGFRWPFLQPELPQGATDELPVISEAAEQDHASAAYGMMAQTDLQTFAPQDGMGSVMVEMTGAPDGSVAEWAPEPVAYSDNGTAAEWTPEPAPYSDNGVPVDAQPAGEALQPVENGEAVPADNVQNDAYAPVPQDQQNTY